MKLEICLCLVGLCSGMVPPIDMCSRCIHVFKGRSGCEAWQLAVDTHEAFHSHEHLDTTCSVWDQRVNGTIEQTECIARMKELCGFDPSFGTDTGCTKDGYVCRDGTVLTRDPTNHCQFPDCAVIDIDFAYAERSKNDLEEFVQTGMNLDQFRQWVVQKRFDDALERCQDGFEKYTHAFMTTPSCAEIGCEHGAENTCCRDGQPTSLDNEDDCRHYLRDVLPSSSDDECCPVCADNAHPHYPFQCERDTFVGPTVCGGESDEHPGEVAEYPLPADWDCSTGPEHHVEFGPEECHNVCHQECDGSHCWDNCHDDCHSNPLPVETCRAVIDEINTAQNSGSDLDFLLHSDDFSAIIDAGFFGMVRATVTGHARVEVSGECVWMPESQNYGTLEMELRPSGQLVLFNVYNDASASLTQPLTIEGGMEVIAVKGDNSAHIQFKDNGHVSVWGLVNQGVTEFLNVQRVSVADVTNTGNIAVHNVRSTNLLRIDNAGGVHVEGGVHVLNEILNTGDVVMSNADAVLSDIVNHGTVRVTGGVLKAKNVHNDGAVTIEGGASIDLHIDTMSGTGSLSIAAGVSGTVRAPASVELTLPSSVVRMFDSSGTSDTGGGAETADGVGTGPF